MGWGLRGDDSQRFKWIERSQSVLLAQLVQCKWHLDAWDTDSSIIQRHHETVDGGAVRRKRLLSKTALRRCGRSRRYAFIELACELVPYRSQCILHNWS